MASMNRVTLLGNLGRDPELRKMQNGDAVANVAIATSERWKDKASGEAKERTEWHNLVFYGRQAEVLAQYCSKGSSILVEGKLQTRKWQDKDGQDRYTTEVVVREMVLLGGGNGEGGRQGGGQQRAAAPAQRQAPAQQSNTEDDIPF